MLAACDRSSDVGLRDYAILTALWRLRLRHGEVAKRTLDDIDWRHGEITIDGKGNVTNSCRSLVTSTKPLPSIFVMVTAGFRLDAGRCS